MQHINQPIKKIGEIDCVRKFLENQKIVFKQCQIAPNDKENNVVDVFWDNKKFQIVYADFKFQKAIKIVPKDENGIRCVKRKRNPNDVWKDFIVNPIIKKNKYGEAAKGIILLINSYTEPPWVENQINIAKKINFNFLKNTGFKEIYLVCPDKNMRVYP